MKRTSKRGQLYAVRAPTSTSSSSTSLHSSLSSPALLLPALFLFRCLNALLVRTYFNPDEPWQSLEAAYSVAFPPAGHRTWEWQADARIRGWLHVSPFILFYRLVKALHADSAFVIAYGPRLLQAALVAVADVHFLSLAKRLFALYLSNWFLLYTLVRTYSNTLETLLTIIALAYWPWPGLPPVSFPSSSLLSPGTLSLLLAAVAVVVRPTALILWLVLGGHALLSSETTPSRMRFVAEAAVIGGAVLLCSAGLDRWMYGEWTLAPYNFLVLNTVHGIAALYGTHPWHWYVTEALPVLLSFSLPLFLHALWSHRRHPVTRCVVPALVVTVAVYSSNPHKEYRFLLPLLPLCMLYAGLSLSSMASTWTRRKLMTSVVVAGNAALFLYFALVHQAGPISAAEFLAHRIAGAPASAAAPSVHFWTPCHAAPLYSYLHVEPRPDLRFLDCAPTFPAIPASSSDVAFSRQCTASHLFLHSPVAFLRHYYNASAAAWGSNDTISADCVNMRRGWEEQDERKAVCERRGGGRVDGWPSYVVIFSNHARAVQAVLTAEGYAEVGRFFHSHFDDEREVLVFAAQ